MGDIDKVFKEFKSSVDKCCAAMRTFLLAVQSPCPPERVWEREDNVLALADMRCASRHGPASLRSASRH